MPRSVGGRTAHVRWCLLSLDTTGSRRDLLAGCHAKRFDSMGDFHRFQMHSAVSWRVMLAFWAPPSWQLQKLAL
eukprot:356968-Chlamydomonas_euryale.AAC.20